MEMENTLSTLVGENNFISEENDNWYDTLAGVDGSIYGIPCNARRVVKFNPVNKSITHIGPDFGGKSRKWQRGAMADNRSIYCPPCNRSYGILKIDTSTDDVTVLDANFLPERGRYDGMWISCALALDGCIYFMPGMARRIIKLDPNNNDAITSVGDDLGGGWKYNGTMVGIDGCVYGIHCDSNRIVKYDPINDTTSFFEEEGNQHCEYDPINDITSFVGNKYYGCTGNGVLGRDGFIYALVGRDRVSVLKIDTMNDSHCFVGYTVDDANRSENQSFTMASSWGDAILGIDGCIYWPPDTALYILRYDPYSNQISNVGDSLGWWTDQWCSGALAPDGSIYCIPSRRLNHILCIDPLKEFSTTVKNDMEENPKEFGCLFHVSEDLDKRGSSPLKTNFDHAVMKFGQNKVFDVLDKHLESLEKVCIESNLYPFMIVASSKYSTLCAILHFLRRDLSWVNYFRRLEKVNV